MDVNTNYVTMGINYNAKEPGETKYNEVHYDQYFTAP